jgi:hypothetical protein
MINIRNIGPSDFLKSDGRMDSAMYRNLIKRALHKASVTLGSDSSGGMSAHEQAALRALVVMLRKEFGEDLFAADKDGTANSVLFALNPATSPWAAIGVNSELDQIIWDLYGFDPQSTKAWLDAGVGPDEAFEWRNHDTDYAIDCLGRGWSARQGQEWKGWNTDNAQRWIDAGASRKMADGWRSHGPSAVPHIKKILDWENSYWSIGDEDKYEKLWKDIELGDAVEFLPKGYTRRSALSAIKKGFTAKTAPPVRGKKLVAGKAFDQFVSVASETGGWRWPTQLNEISGLDTSPTISAEFYHPEQGRRLTMVFTASGRFLGCRDNWERAPLRSVKDVEQVLRHPARYLRR